jgi:hypothetical protein
MNKLISFLFAALTFTSFSSCDDDEAEATATLAFEFDARVGTQNLQLGTTSYKNSLGQDFTVDVFRYYISNIKLKKSDGTFYEDPLSQDGAKGYYLIDDSDAASTLVTLTDVPFGKYTGAEFTIGVDASRVSQGAQTGALDPVNNLFWSWNSGYIFVQLEGTSPQSTEDDNVIMYHTGGYKTDPSNANLANNIKIKSITFGGDDAIVGKTTEPEIHIVVDVKKFFEGVTTIDFSTNNHCHSPACGVSIANNYESTFIFDHLHQ